MLNVEPMLFLNILGRVLPALGYPEDRFIRNRRESKFNHPTVTRMRVNTKTCNRHIVFANISRSYLFWLGVTRQRRCRDGNIRRVANRRPRSRFGTREPLDEKMKFKCSESDRLTIRFRFCLLKETLKHSAPIIWWRFLALNAVPCASHRKHRDEAFQTRKRSKWNRSNTLPHGLGVECFLHPIFLGVLIASMSFLFSLSGQGLPYLCTAHGTALRSLALLGIDKSALSQEAFDELNDTQGVGPASERRGYVRPRDESR